MRTSWVLGLLIVVELSARTAPVAVCLRNTGIVQGFVLYRAKVLAAGIFASIGVPVEWKCSASNEGRIVVELEDATPAFFKPGALASARPYATRGSLIHVFYDRVRDEHPPSLTSVLLGHVLAHEITHVLEGVARHSAEGVMKDHWDLRDFEQMDIGPLRLAPADVDLILSRRAAI